MSINVTAHYLYCLTPPGRDVRPSLIGVDGRNAVAECVCGQIGAVISEVDLEEFCGESAEARLQDLGWLGPRVCRHEAVIEEVMRQAPVLPARFATLFTSGDSLQRYVIERQEAIAEFFARLGEQREWAVKGLLDRAGALAGPPRPDQAAAEERTQGASPGARYFQEKRIKAQWERDFTVRLKEFCQRAAATLGAQAGGFRERKALAAVTEETAAETVLNWAFLVSPAAIEDFRARLERFNDGEAFPGLRMALSGPWPPYSFAPDLSAGAAGEASPRLGKGLA